eukprot:13066551-Alexandrium_andersonii.AAC.1
MYTDPRLVDQSCFAPPELLSVRVFRSICRVGHAPPTTHPTTAAPISRKGARCVGSSRCRRTMSAMNPEGGAGQ